MTMTNDEFVTEVLQLAPRRERTPARPGMSLSPREVEVLRLLSLGYSYSDIAQTLYISLDTVKSHCKRLFIKLDANNGAHAVGKAYRAGLLIGGGGEAA